MKRTLSVILAFVMLLSFALPGMAADTNATYADLAAVDASLVDEGADRLCLAFDGERGVAGEEHVAVVLDTGADLLVDDFIERIVQRHVDGAEAVAVLVVAQAEILRPPAEEAEQAADHEERGEGDEQ